MFRAKNYVETDLKEIYSSKIEHDLGIKLGPDELSGIEPYLQRKALNDPEGLVKLANKTKEFKELPEEINKTIRRIYSHDRLKKMEAILEKVTGPLNVVNFKWTELAPTENRQNESLIDTSLRYGKYLSKALLWRTADVIDLTIRTTATAARKVLKKTPLAKDYFKSEEETYNEKILREKFQIEPEGAEVALKKIREELSQIKEAKLERKKLEERQEVLRTELFNENFAPTVIAGEIARRKLREQLKDMLTVAKAPDATDKLFELKQKIQMTKFAGDGSFDYTKDRSIESVAEDLDTAIEIQTGLQLQEALKKMSSLTELEEILKPFLTADKETKKLLTDKIKYIVNLSTGQVLHPENVPKFAILKLFLTKIELEELEESIRANSWIETARERIATSFT